MADEEDAGAAYLAALKQSSAPHPAGAAPARAPLVPSSVPRSPDPRTGGANPTGSVDKRRSPRYRCQGSAHIHEIGPRGDLDDVYRHQLHGCYVETTTTYSVALCWP